MNYNFPNTQKPFPQSLYFNPPPVPQNAGLPSHPATQEAHSLAEPTSSKKTKVQTAYKKLQISVDLLKDFENKNLRDQDTRARIFKILNNGKLNGPTFESREAFEKRLKRERNRFKKEHNSRNLPKVGQIGQTVFQNIYYSQDIEAIQTLESLLLKVIHTPVSLRGSKTSQGIFQLCAILEIPKILKQYFVDYLTSLKMKDLTATDTALFKKVSLYFTYAILTQRLEYENPILDALSTLVKEQPLDVIEQFQSEIATIFGYFLKDLNESSRQAYSKNWTYDNPILSTCRNFPFLADAFYDLLLSHFLIGDSISSLGELLNLEVSKEIYFFDFIYSKIDLEKNLETLSEADKQFLKTISDFEHYLTRIWRVDHLIRRFKNQPSPNLLKYLQKVPLTSLTQDKKAFYLFLSIALRNIACIQRFSAIQIETEATLKKFHDLILHSFYDFFEIGPSGTILDQPNTEASTQDIRLIADSKALFFEILSHLKPLKILASTKVMGAILSASLFYDRQYPGPTSRFDMVLKQLQAIGFNLHCVDPIYRNNLILEAFDLSHIDFIIKLIELGVNPFLLNQKGFSFFKIEQGLAKIPGMETLNTTWRERALSVLALKNLDKHRFLQPDFERHSLKQGKGWDEKDEQGRTPLMLYVMCNRSIQPFLQRITLEILSAQDKEGKTLWNYAEANQDTEALKLLNSLKKRLTQKSGFRKLAQAAANLTKKEPLVSPSKPTSTTSKKKGGPTQVPAATPSVASTPEINLYYDAATGEANPYNEYSRANLEQKIAEQEKKVHKKEEKVNRQASSKDQEGLFQKTKRRVKEVGQAINLASHLRSHPEDLLKTFSKAFNNNKNIASIGKGEVIQNLTRPPSVRLLSDGSSRSPFTTLEELAQEVVDQKLKEAPQGHIIDTLNHIQEAIQHNPRLKINRHKVLEVLQWVVGGKIEYGKGSHLNLRYAGGVLTIPQNKDGSDNADILYIKKVANTLMHYLRGLLLGYEVALDELSAKEDAKDEMPEPSESEESKD